MNNFEVFLKALLKKLFKEYPYSKEKEKSSFEKVKSKTTNGGVGANNGDRK